MPRRTPSATAAAARRSTPRWRWPRELIDAGADILDIGGESAHHRAPGCRWSSEELERVVPLVERVAGELGAIVSVDTYKPQVARAAIAAGALHRQRRQRAARSELADDLRADRRRAGGDAHARRAARTPAGPRPLRRRGRGGARIPAPAHRASRSPRAWRAEQLIVDPGPDFAKTPAQTIELLRSARSPARARTAASDGDLAQGLHRRADRSPAARAAGGYVGRAGARLDAGAQLFRVHDVAAAADFLAVRAALGGSEQPSGISRSTIELRHDPQAG